MPATSQQGFSCAACIRATGAVGLLCPFAGGAACARRVAGERFSTTMTAKATVADFFVITDLRLTQPHTLGKVVSASQPPTTALQAKGEQAEPLFCGLHRKGKSPTVKHTGGPTRIVGGGAGPSGQNLLADFILSRSACGLRLGESYLGVGNQLRQSTLVLQTSNAMKKQTQVFQSLAIGLLVLGMAVVGSRLNAQQTSSSPVDTRAQAQEPQGQQPAQQPGQEYPAGQQSQQPQQPAPSAQQPGQPGAQAGQPQGVQTFTGMIVKSGDKYVLQDSATGTTYDIDHQDELSKHVGRKVQVTGTLDPNGKMIHLQPSER